MEAKTISTTDTSRIIRAALKSAFPGVKFSVRSDFYSGGSSIEINYTDGPAQIDVEAIAKGYEGASFDGMEDLKSYHDSRLNGEVVRFGADFIFVHQHFTDETRKAIRALMPADFNEWDTTEYYEFNKRARAYCRRSFPTPLITNAPKRIVRSA